jgi:hypothetical protein
MTALHPDIEGCVVPDALTRQECAQVLAQADAAGFRGGVFAGDRLRATVMSPHIADRLWRRLAPHLQSRVHDTDLGMHNFVGECTEVPSGRYEAVGINPLLRVSKYSSGGSFRTHVDSCYATSDQNVGMHTVLVYLNEDVRGGSTVVYADGGRGRCEIVPEIGKALVFYHYTRHEGEPVEAGFKYVIRTEVMFRLVAHAHAKVEKTQKSEASAGSRT